jgi:DNA-binding response OmpR family regulator
MNALLLEEKKRTPPLAEPGRHSGLGLRVLLVDESEAAVSLALLLRMHGHQVEHGPAKLVAVERSDADQPDVVILDLGLPGSDGRLMAKRFQNCTAKKPFLIGLSRRGAGVKCCCSQAAGVHLELANPVDLILLVKVLRRLQAVLLPRTAEQ